MSNRFTDRARKVMQLANEQAILFRHEYIGTEHILLGLIAEGAGVAATALKNLNVDLNKVRREIERIVTGGLHEVTSFEKLPLTPRAKKVVECAIDEARKFCHDYVGTEHLLLGLLRESDGVAAQVLMNLGLELKAVREAVMALLNQSMPQDRMTRDLEPEIQSGPDAARAEKAARIMISDIEAGATEKIRSAIGPAQIDRLVRQALHFCWMALPKEKRNTEAVETQIRRLLDRALRDFREDLQAFGREEHPA